MDKDLVAVMVTIDRSPQENFLSQTLENLKRSDLDSCPRLSHLAIFNSAPDAFVVDVLSGQWPNGRVVPMSANRRLVANENVAAALDYGAKSGAEWVIFLEDDIDVVGQFFASTGAWLDCHGERNLISVFGSVLSNPDDDYLEVLADGFYGTQAIAIRSEHAASLSEYLKSNVYAINPEGVCYDLLMGRWAKERGEVSFGVSSPSFVQHIGRTSVIHPRPSVHVFPSFPGSEWSYFT